MLILRQQCAIITMKGGGIMNNVGLKIKEYRIANDWSQQELADKMGYKSKTTIAKIESGVNDVSQSNLVKFAEIFNVTPAHLLESTNDNVFTCEYAELGANVLKSNKIMSYLSKCLKLEQTDQELIMNMIDTLYNKKEE